jgi:hypothetical protein
MKTPVHLFAYLSVLTLVSCQTPAKRLDDLTPTSREMTIGLIVIEVPAQDTIVKTPGIDSYVTRIITSKKDTFEVEYGRPGIIYSLYDGSVPVFRTSSKEWVVKEIGKQPSPGDVVFSDDPTQDNETRIFDKNFWLYDTINGIVSKIVQPKKIGDGMTGLYIPRLRDSMSFSIYGNNLDSSAHTQAMRMFRTVHYIQSSTKKDSSGGGH